MSIVCTGNFSIPVPSLTNPCLTSESTTAVCTPLPVASITRTLTWDGTTLAGGGVSPKVSSRAISSLAAGCFKTSDDPNAVDGFSPHGMVVNSTELGSFTSMVRNARTSWFSSSRPN